MEFEMRELKSSDIIPMVNILSAIGFKDLKKTFTPERIAELTTVAKSTEDDSQTRVFGATVIMDVVELLMDHLEACEKPVFKFLASLTGMKEEEIADIGLVPFTELVIAVLQKEEFKDFFKVVSKLFK